MNDNVGQAPGLRRAPQAHLSRRDGAFRLRALFWLSLSVSPLLGRASNPELQEYSALKVLTVCEVLRNIPRYNGTNVVVVGYADWTFEGTFMHEQCDRDDHIVIQGHRWLSMIAVGAVKPVLARAPFPVSDAILHEMLLRLKEDRNSEDLHLAKVPAGEPRVLNLSHGLKTIDDLR